MTGRFVNLKATLIPLIILLAATSNLTQAALEDSFCDSTGNLSIQNLNLKGGKFSPGQELQRVTIPISYTCTISYTTYGPGYRPTLGVTPSFQSVINSLKGSGLALDVIIQESGQTPVTFPWSELKRAVTSGSSITKGFGAWLPNPRPPTPAPPYNLNGNMTLRFFVDSAFITNKPISIKVPGIPAFQILSHDPDGVGAKAGKPITTSTFNIRFIPDYSGRVIVSPSVVRMGHFYTDYNDTLAKQVPFTVTAQQNLGAGSPFSAPLAIEFKTTGLTLTDSGRAVILHNTDGQLNGLKLVVEDEASTPVIFNSVVPMGTINMGYEPNGKIIKTYTATVTPISGETVKTGNFSVAMTITITYI